MNDSAVVVSVRLDPPRQIGGQAGQEQPLTRLLPAGDGVEVLQHDPPVPANRTARGRTSTARSTFQSPAARAARSSRRSNRSRIRWSSFWHVSPRHSKWTLPSSQADSAAARWWFFSGWNGHPESWTTTAKGARPRRLPNAARSSGYLQGPPERSSAPAKNTVAQYLATWLETRQAADISPGTRALDKLIVEAHLIPHLGSVPLQKLGTAHVSKMYADLAKTRKGKTVRNVHGVLRKALGDATRWKPRPLLATNPLDGMKSPARADSVIREAWSAEEVHRFLKVAAEDRLGAIWRLALATGLRRGELRGLTWTTSAKRR